MPNSLIQESSLYLRQHAHNPVDWMPWGNAAFEKAQKENKPVIISIGYSSCHWCHVMEKECFEDHEAAEVMNLYFISIKVDREEHPDVDAYYMMAVQLLGGHGGWPLNVFCLPDGSPFYGGTYFPKAQWIHVLDRIRNLYQYQKHLLAEQAQRLKTGIQKADRILFDRKSPATEVSVSEVLQKAVSLSDHEFGGENRAPKFPMPGKYYSYLKCADAFGLEEVKNHVRLSLQNIALRGLYDHLDGGFFRYSTDMEWKIPHFEKMLYDNAQLLELYAVAYRYFNNKTFLYTAEKTAEFLLEKMYDPLGYFYSSMDADSEGEEGKYYAWTENEIQKALGKDADSFFKLISWGEQTHWEHQRHVLLLWKPHNADDVVFNHDLQKYLTVLKTFRSKNKIPPATDKKMILSWNALAAKAFAKAGLLSGRKDWIRVAEKNISFIMKNLMKGDALLRIFENGTAKVNAVSEDYALLCDALFAVFVASGNFDYLNAGKKLIEKCLTDFCDENGFFYQYPFQENNIHGNLRDVQDNVIPSPNAVIASCLMNYSKALGLPEWHLHAMKMADVMKYECLRHPATYYRWLEIMPEFVEKSADAVLVGNFVDEMIFEWYRRFPINTNLLFSNHQTSKGIFQDKEPKDGKATLYICKGMSCSPPLPWESYVCPS
ncbi:MAG: thioredoxin domain-containing protein [Bacteroidia bacterium]|nr:thioredoxin domain-containing protein [Bacteroidia bacterium]